jgi:hypothetical protein
MKILIMTVLAATVVCAQDPPSRVARLNMISGPVSFQPAGLDTWANATMNYPLTTGDHLYADMGARAEMHIGPNAIRLNSMTNFGFLNLDDGTVQMRFTGGAMEVRLRALDDQDLYEVDTPNGAISLLRGGDYRIDSDPDRNFTMLTVFAGEAEVTANGTSFAVHPRQTGYFSDNAPPEVRPNNPPDDFDQFTADRNMSEERLPPPQHVPQSMVGYQDLNAYGAWRNTPDYGWVWVPPVQAGWVPYRDGHWAWVEPWGWTWIDDAPWGFAPFHYGRWVVAGGGWVWIPGAVAVRPVYAPALVAFVGGPRFRIGFGIGGGIGAVAWFPLGPQEVFRPAYRVSNTYVTRVNITNVTNVTTINNVTNVRYVNQNVQGAVTAVPQNAFTSAQSVRTAGIRVSPQQMAQAQVVGTAPQVAPQRESLMGGGRVGATVAQPPKAMVARQVVAKSTPPPPPVSFAARQSALAQNQGRPLAPEQVAQLRQQPGATINGTPVRTTSAPAPSPASAFARPAPAPVPSAGGSAPVNRLDSRPPNATRVAPGNPPAAPPAQNQPLFNRAQEPAQQIAPRPDAAAPAADAARPVPAANRPTPAKKTHPKKEEEERKDERR